MNNIFYCNINRNILRKVIAKIGLERIDMQKRVIMKTLLNNNTIGLIMSSEFTRKQIFKLKIKRLIYIRNVNRVFNKKRLIENTIEVNIYYQIYKKRTEIDIIGDQK